MRRIGIFFGRIVFWVGWPLWKVLLQRGERARVVVVKSNHHFREILFVQSYLGPGSWGLPGGGVHRDEAPVVAAARELQEETGIAIHAKQLLPLGFISETQFYGIKYRAHYFLLELNGDISLHPQLLEIADMRWKTYPESREQLEALGIWESVETTLKQ